MTKPNQVKQFRFADRRLRYSLVTIAVLIVISFVVYSQNRNLHHSSFTTGYLLFGAIIFLTLFNLRKKLPFLPSIGSAATWMQAHIYVGLSTFVIFAFHIGWKIPNGMFETFLAMLYLSVALSGVYGLYVTRVMPKRLSALQEEIIYERIPGFRIQIARQTRELVLQACETTDVLAKFYVNKLAMFFEQPRGLAYMISPTGHRRRHLISEIQNLDRYLGPDQRKIGEQLKVLVKQKDDLDFHSAIQGRLKFWLFLHIGMTYSLVIVGILHGIMAHAFAGGLQ